MGVLTSAEFLGTEKKKEKVQPETTVRAVAYDKRRFFLRFAGKGDTGLAFYYDKVEYNIRLTDGFYIVPEDASDSRLEAWEKILLSVGFERVKESDDSAGGIAKDPPVEKPRDPEGKIYVVYHPDTTPSNLINAKVKINVGGKTREVEIVNGRVETDSITVKKALLKMGYMDTEAPGMGDQKTEEET